MARTVATEGMGGTTSNRPKRKSKRSPKPVSNKVPSQVPGKNLRFEEDENNEEPQSEVNEPEVVSTTADSGSPNGAEIGNDTDVHRNDLHAAYRGGGLLDLSISFANFGARYLDGRLTRAITRTLGLEHPTLVQSATIPLILEGKDVLARARTGSGKTLAYTLPIIQRILEGLQKSDTAQSALPLQACVLLPTRELCVQVFP